MLLLVLASSGHQEGPITVPEPDRDAIQSFGGQQIMIVHGIQMPAKCELSEIAAAVEGFGFFFGSRERRQEQSSQYRDDRDDYEQLDEREGGARAFWMYHYLECAGKAKRRRRCC